MSRNRGYLCKNTAAASGCVIVTRQEYLEGVVGGRESELVFVSQIHLQSELPPQSVASFTVRYAEEVQKQHILSFVQDSDEIVQLIPTYLTGSARLLIVG